MPIKVFKIKEQSYNEDVINDWADKNDNKITGIDVCPFKWYLNNSKDGVEDVDLVVTVIYHKKRRRRKQVNE